MVSSGIGPFIIAIEKMNKKILTFILTSIWLLFWASPSIALVTEFQKAVDAYKGEDYKTSYKLTLPLAKKRSDWKIIKETWIPRKKTT